MKEFQKIQLAFIRYLRNQDAATSNKTPVSRSKSIYRDLAYGNINRIISDSFPATKSITTNTNWHLMISDFISNHISESPLFLDISKEFLAYLFQERSPQDSDPPCMLELAHFEWICLALDIANIDLPKPDPLPASECSFWVASPLVVGLTYQYPVHLVDAQFLPQKQHAPAYLLVFRNRHDDVEFQETNAFTLRIVQLLQQQDAITCLELSKVLASEMNDVPTAPFILKTQSILYELTAQDIVCYTNPIKLT